MSEYTYTVCVRMMVVWCGDVVCVCVCLFVFVRVGQGNENHLLGPRRYKVKEEHVIG